MEFRLFVMKKQSGTLFSILFQKRVCRTMLETKARFWEWNPRISSIALSKRWTNQNPRKWNQRIKWKKNNKDFLNEYALNKNKLSLHFRHWNIVIPKTKQKCFGNIFHNYANETLSYRKISVLKLESNSICFRHLATLEDN